jgi:RHS repeat-associated protein
MGPSYSAAATGGQNGLYNESYTYNSTTGNLASKAGVSYTYDTNHPHAVASLSNGNTYTYDANGNMTQRVVNGQTFNLSYDAENRMISVSGTGINVAFTYDADGKRVQQVLNNATTKFIGNHYEVEGTTVRKYYLAGASRVAMRTGTSAPVYFLQDHLGSTNLTTDSSGNFVAEIMYKPWGEVRSVDGTTPTNYTYTGQYSNTADFGLMYYGARWYDPSLSRFAQADSIIPHPTQGTQAWDRYAYGYNNPSRYIDPSGHLPCSILIDGEYCFRPVINNSVSALDYLKSEIYSNYGVTLSNEGKPWTATNAAIVLDSLNNISNINSSKVMDGIRGSTYVMAEYDRDCTTGNCYYGKAVRNKITFFTIGNAAIRQMNIYHEIGHQIDSRNKSNYTNNLISQGEPSYIDDDYINSKALVNQTNITNPFYTMSVEVIQASGPEPDEQWADIFANFVAGNIDISHPFGPGMDMYNFVTKVLGL